MTEHTKEFLGLYDNNERIPSFILREVLCHNRIIIEQVGENRRWTREVTSIVSIPVDGGERLFAIYWDEGLTEYQENEYWSAEEVKFEADMKQIKVEISEERYVSLKDGTITTSFIKTTELE